MKKTASHPLLLPNSQAFIHLDRLRANFLTLRRLLQQTYGGLSSPALIAMVKANAYGHGATQVVDSLSRLPSSSGLWGFGVATFQEGIEIRRTHKKLPVLIFSGDWSDAEHSLGLCEKYQLTPVLHEARDVMKWQGLLSRRSSPVRPHIKINTGLERLGIDARDFFLLTPRLRWEYFGGVLTHFSAAEKLDRHAREQATLFHELVRISGAQDHRGAQDKKVKNGAKRSEKLGPHPFLIHAFSTGGLFVAKKLGLHEICNAVRPGISLYGYAPQWPTNLQNANLLKPVLEWRVFVRKRRELSPGDLVGYDASFEVKRKLTQTLLSVGYADGFKRSLSNQDILVGLSAKKKVNLAPARVLGRVSMDLVSLETELVYEDYIALLGLSTEQGQVFASKAQTIIYEVLTSLSNRVPRVYL